MRSRAKTTGDFYVAGGGVPAWANGAAVAADSASAPASATPEKPTVITYADLTLGSLPCDGIIQRTWTATDSWSW